MVQIALEDAQAYARWAGRELPSEAQLEYAMRGGLTDADFSWGVSELPLGKLMANTWQGQFPYHNTAADGFTGTAPVGCFPANGFGLFDAGGNVWELTHTGYTPGHDALRDAALDPPGPSLRESMDPADPGVPVVVIKGGSHLCSADRCMRYRPSARQPQPVFMATSHVGFRTIRQYGVTAEHRSQRRSLMTGSPKRHEHLLAGARVDTIAGLLATGSPHATNRHPR